MNANTRFIMVLDTLKSKGIIRDYATVASELGTNGAGISDIKGGRKKVSVEMLANMKILYNIVNLEYIILGRGEPLITEADSNVPQSKPNLLENSFADNQSNIPDGVFGDLIQRITTQAEEIGRLKAENEILREENSRYAICEKGGSAIESIAEIA